MKLRNKKTGDIKSIKEIIRDAFLSNELDSLKSIDTNWKDVDSTNDTNIPLIKDEKIRKVVRAWFEANGFNSKMFFTYYANLHHLCCWQASIEFNRPIDGLEDGKDYYITELCGEEEA